ncbi:MAG TPA: glutathione peroxidase, partial [Flavobacteriaceae bacterium]|nr:glutathione peroxidase [Flavobacteriaceae bacterium]
MTDKLLQMDLESLKLGLLSSNKFWNKKLIIFNTASLCGFTKQLADFQKIFIDGLAVPIAIPTNDFGKQEPGDDYEILQFAKKTYGVTFPICKKTDINHKFFK